MKFSTIKRSIAPVALALSSTLFLSCGGSGTTTTVTDYIPTGTTLNLFMGEYILSVYVTSDNYGYMLWESKYPKAEGMATFSFVDQGNNISQFKTAFVYNEGTFIDIGPTIVTTWAKASITANMVMPENLGTDAYRTAFHGNLDWSIYLEGSANSVIDKGLYTGTGEYGFQPTR